MKFTCAPDMPCRYPEWRSGGEVEGKRLHLRGVYPTELPAELFCGADELQILFYGKPGLHIQADIRASSAATGNRLQIRRFSCFPVAGGVGLSAV